MNIEIEDIKKISLKPDDVLIIKVKENLPTNKCIEWSKSIKELFNVIFPNNKIIILDSEVSLEIISPEKPKKEEKSLPDGIFAQIPESLIQESLLKDSVKEICTGGYKFGGVDYYDLDQSDPLANAITLTFTR